jgi:RNA polymerase sigma factor (sigma-70 family)
VTLLLGDRALLDRFRAGERSAIQRVYHAYVDQVAALLRKGFPFMSGGQVMHFRGYDNAWDLECAVQDTFSHAFNPAARQAYDGVSPYGPYLLTIARNRVISQLRSDWRELRRRTAVATEIPESPQTPEEQAIRGELRGIIDEFCATLEPIQLRLLELRYREERSLLEAARILGLTRMKARTLEQKLRQAFVRFLRQQGYLRGGGGSAPTLLALAMGGR